jgi:hypothetical protein
MGADVTFGDERFATDDGAVEDPNSRRILN